MHFTMRVNIKTRHVLNHLLFIYFYFSLLNIFISSGYYPHISLKYNMNKMQLILIFLVYSSQFVWNQNWLNYLRNSWTPGLLNSCNAVFPNMVAVLPPVFELNKDGRIRCHFGWCSYCWYVFRLCTNDFGFISIVLTLLLILTRFASPAACFGPGPDPWFMIMLYSRSV